MILVQMKGEGVKICSKWRYVINEQPLIRSPLYSDAGYPLRNYCIYLGKSGDIETIATVRVLE